MSHRTPVALMALVEALGREQDKSTVFLIKLPDPAPEMDLEAIERALYNHQHPPLDSRRAVVPAHMLRRPKRT